LIEAAEFIRRLEALALGGVGPGLPRRERDRHILLKAAALSLGRELPCSERHLGLVLRNWLVMLAPRVDIDPVSLRRALVDFGYLERDVAGQSYQLSNSHAAQFAPDVENLVPLDLVASARQRMTSKAEKRERLG
jgi:hypothetical protein